MKVFAILAAASVAVVSAVDCDILALTPVATSADASQCGIDAEGYSVIAAKYPTATQLPKMCLSKACNNLLAALKAAAPTECDITIVTPSVALYKTLLTPIETACEKVKKDAASGGATTAPTTTSAAPTTTTVAPATTTKAPATTTAAPATTTEAPASTTEAPAQETASGSGSGGEEIESPSSPAVTKAASNATTPTPAPTSGVSAVATAAGAVVFAVAASMF